MVKAEKLDCKEVLELVTKAVNSQWYKYPSVRNTHEKDDIIQDVMVKLLTPREKHQGKNFLEYYDASKQSCGNLETIIRVVTNRYFIDVFKSQKQVYSLDMDLSHNDEGFTLYDLLAEKDNPLVLVELEDLIDRLPNDKVISRAVLRYPHYEKGVEVGYTEQPVSYKALLKLVMEGLDITTIAKHCINQKTNKPIYSSRVSKLLIDAKGMLMEMIKES